MPSQTVADTLQKWNEIKIENCEKNADADNVAYRMALHVCKQIGPNMKNMHVAKEYEDEAVLCTLHTVHHTSFTYTHCLDCNLCFFCFQKKIQTKHRKLNSLLPGAFKVHKCT